MNFPGLTAATRAAMSFWLRSVVPTGVPISYGVFIAAWAGGYSEDERLINRLHGR